MTISSLFTILIVVILLHITSIAVYKLPPKDKDVLEAIEKYDVKLNSINDNIFRIGDMPNYIAKPAFYTIFTYYIQNVGVIPFWYKSNKILKKMHNDAKKKVFKSKREELGL